MDSHRVDFGRDEKGLTSCRKTFRPRVFSVMSLFGLSRFGLGRPWVLGTRCLDRLHEVVPTRYLHLNLGRRFARRGG